MMAVDSIIADNFFVALFFIAALVDFDFDDVATPFFDNDDDDDLNGLETVREVILVRAR